ncbi:hypothetical protein GEMRC1_004164 [Eukaryota sp. GEM-RC1]
MEQVDEEVSGLLSKMEGGDVIGGLNKSVESLIGDVSVLFGKKVKHYNGSGISTVTTELISRMTGVIGPLMKRGLDNFVQYELAQFKQKLLIFNNSLVSSMGTRLDQMKSKSLKNFSDFLETHILLNYLM